jgi:hypothetical protein
MKTLLSLVFLAMLLATLGPGLASAGSDPFDPARSPFSTINDLAAAGRITESQAQLYRVYALFAPAELPQAYRVPEAVPIRCGTPTFVDAWQGRDRLPEEDGAYLDRLRVRPNLDSYIDTPHFRVHYSTSGANMIYGWPNTAFRDSVISSCEKGYALYVTMGFPAPPSDGTEGGNSKIDCYCDALGTGVMGVTFPESALGDPYPYTYTAYFIIDHDFTQYGGNIWDNMRVTVVHEYMHVVQMGMNAQTSSWWMENCATWSEDRVYDESNQYVGYLRSFFARPWIGLRTADGMWEYACMIWPTYLGERFSIPIVRDIWLYDAVNTNLTNAFENVIPQYGSGYTWDLAVNEWARWNYYTCSRADGSHYSEGGEWYDPNPVAIAFDKDISTYPQTDVHPTTSRWPVSLGTNYTRFKPQTGSTDNHLTVTFTGLNVCEYNWQLFFIRKFTGQNLFEEFVVPIDAAGNATFEMGRWNETENLYMGVELKRACGSSQKDFKFSASTSTVMDVTDGTLPVRVVRLEQNVPNPFNPVTTIRYTTRETAPVAVIIYDAAGRQVRALVSATQQAGEHQVRWFGDDDAGRHVPAGPYFCTVRTGDEVATRKMLMVE